MPDTALHPDGPNSPHELADAAVADFMRQLRELRTQAGAPSYAVLSSRTGLPRSTVYDALRRDRLPALDTALALVRALGGDPAQWRDRWTEVRSVQDQPLTTGAPSEPADSGGRTAGRTNPDGRRWLRALGGWRRPTRLIPVLALVLVLVAVGIVFALRSSGGSGCARAEYYTVTSAGDLLDDNAQQIGRTQAGDTLEVLSHKHGSFQHRLRGTIMRTGAVGYVDEARIDPARKACA